MSTNTKNAEAFIDLLDIDEQLRKEFEARSGSPEALEDFLKSGDWEFTISELHGALHSKVGAPENIEITDSALEGISGGGVESRRHLNLNLQRLKKMYEFDGANPGEKIVIHTTDYDQGR